MRLHLRHRAGGAATTTAGGTQSLSAGINSFEGESCFSISAVGLNNVSFNYIADTVRNTGDFLTFYLNGASRMQATAQTNWRAASHALGGVAGQSDMTTSCLKGAPTSSGAHAVVAYVDELVIKSYRRIFVNLPDPLRVAPKWLSPQPIDFGPVSNRSAVQGHHPPLLPASGTGKVVGNDQRSGRPHDIEHVSRLRQTSPRRGNAVHRRSRCSRCRLQLRTQWRLRHQRRLCARSGLCRDRMH